MATRWPKVAQVAASASVDDLIINQVRALHNLPLTTDCVIQPSLFNAGVSLSTATGSPQSKACPSLEKPAQIEAHLRNVCDEYLKKQYGAVNVDNVVSWLVKRYALLVAHESQSPLQMVPDHHTSLTYIARREIKKDKPLGNHYRTLSITSKKDFINLGISEDSRFLDWGRKRSHPEALWIGPSRALKYGCDDCSNCIFESNTVSNLGDDEEDVRSVPQRLVATQDIAPGTELIAHPGLSTALPECACAIASPHTVTSPQSIRLSRRTRSTSAEQKKTASASPSGHVARVPSKRCVLPSKEVTRAAKFVRSSLPPETTIATARTQEQAQLIALDLENAQLRARITLLERFKLEKARLERLLQQNTDNFNKETARLQARARCADEDKEALILQNEFLRKMSEATISKLRDTERLLEVHRRELDAVKVQHAEELKRNFKERKDENKTLRKTRIAISDTLLRVQTPRNVKPAISCTLMADVKSEHWVKTQVQPSQLAPATSPYLPDTVSFHSPCPSSARL